MFSLSYINIKWFLISFGLGLLLVYCLTPTPEIIVKYPTPENANELVFKDDTKNCYKFNTKEVNCPTDKTKINSIPIQRKIEHFNNELYKKNIPTY